MDIKSVLDERVIDLNMTAKNKKEAIEKAKSHVGVMNQNDKKNRRKERRS